MGFGGVFPRQCESICVGGARKICIHPTNRLKNFFHHPVSHTLEQKLRVVVSLLYLLVSKGWKEAVPEKSGSQRLETCPGVVLLPTRSAI